MSQSDNTQSGRRPRKATAPTGSPAAAGKHDKSASEQSKTPSVLDSVLEQAQQHIDRQKAIEAERTKLDENDQLTFVAVQLIAQQAAAHRAGNADKRRELDERQAAHNALLGITADEPAQHQLNSAPSGTPEGSTETPPSTTDDTSTPNPEADQDNSPKAAAKDDEVLAAKFSKLDNELQRDYASGNYRGALTLLSLADFNIDKMSEVYEQLGVRPGTVLTHHVLQRAVKQFQRKHPSKAAAKDTTEPKVVTLKETFANLNRRWGK